MSSQMIITSSPQIHSVSSTSRIMWTVSLCLLPAGIWGIYVFGTGSLLILLASILTALVTEAGMGLLFKKFTLLDGSAFLTGLLIGYNMPPSVPLYIPITASFFAIAVVKWSFGGLGCNWMNPALAGRVFVFFSWTDAMSTWQMPKTLTDGVVAVSGATPLGSLKTALIESSQGATGPIPLLNSLGYPVSSMDVSVTEWLNVHIFNFLGVQIPGGYVDPFVGNVGGCIGEVSALLLLAGTVVLLIRKIVTWDIPLSYLGVFAVLTWVFGGTRYGAGFFNGDVLFHLLTGGLILGVFFMATDMVTSPMTKKGRLIFGAGAGFLTFLIRFYGSFPEGVSLAIILMNIFVPLIDRFTKNKRYGVLPAKEAGLE